MFLLIVAAVIAVQLIITALFVLSVKKKGEQEYGEYMDSVEYKEFKNCRLLPMGMYICPKNSLPF